MANSGRKRRRTGHHHPSSPPPPTTTTTHRPPPTYLPTITPHHDLPSGCSTQTLFPPAVLTRQPQLSGVDPVAWIEWIEGMCRWYTRGGWRVGGKPHDIAQHMPGGGGLLRNTDVTNDVGVAAYVRGWQRPGRVARATDARDRARDRGVGDAAEDFGLSPAWEGGRGGRREREDGQKRLLVGGIVVRRALLRDKQTAVWPLANGGGERGRVLQDMHILALLFECVQGQ